MFRTPLSLSFAFLLLGCGRTEPGPPAPTQPQQMQGIRVQVVKARLGRLASAPLVTGQVVPWRASVVTARAPGLITDRPVDNGAVVKTGDLLVRIDSSRQRLALKTAQTGLALRQHDLSWLQGDVERKRVLAKKNALSKLELEAAEHQLARAQLAVQEANLAVARAQRELADTLVRAAHDGTVSNVRLGVGDLAAPGVPLMELVDLSRVRVEVGLSGHEIARLHVGDRVMARVDDLGGAPLATTVAAIAPRADPRSGLFVVELHADQASGADEPAPLVRAGMVATVQLTQEGEPRVLLPRAALIRRNGALSVFVAKGTRAQLRQVVAGEADAEDMEILEGVSAGEAVITSALHALTDGAAIWVEPTTASTTSGGAG